MLHGGVARHGVQQRLVENLVLAKSGGGWFVILYSLTQPEMSAGVQVCLQVVNEAGPEIQCSKLRQVTGPAAELV